MGRSIYCSTCKKEKEAGRDNESRCKACKSQANKDKRAKKRAEKGIEPFNTGRSLYCYDCKSLKEVRSYGYCNACRRKKDNDKRLANGITKKHQTGLCPCGNKRADYSSSYCISCLSVLSKKWHSQNPLSKEQVERRRERNRSLYHKKKNCDDVEIRNPLSEEQRLIRNYARNITRRYIKLGKLIPQSCEICGTNVNIHAHHDDYEKPIDIRWLCRKHHAEHHRKIL